MRPVLFALLAQVGWVLCAPRRAAWVYGTSSSSQTIDPVNLTQIAQFYGLDELILSISARYLDNNTGYQPSYDAYVVSLTTAMQTAGLRAQLMTLEDVAFINNPTTSWTAHVYGAESFMRRHPGLFAGIHFDVEVVQDAGWSTEANRPSIFQSFISLLHSVGSYIRASPTMMGIEVMIDVPRWYMNNSYTGQWPWNLQSYNYHIANMVYGGTGWRISDFTGGALQQMDVLPAFMGIGVDEFANRTTLLAFRDQMEAQFAYHPKFLGTSLYSFTDLMADYWANPPHQSGATDAAAGGVQGLVMVMLVIAQAWLQPSGT